MSKPLHGPIFGKIPHLPGSRTGPNDRHISENEAKYYTTRKKSKHENIIVTEKMDGSCVGVFRTPGGDLVPLQRHGYDAGSSPREHIVEFSRYLDKYERRFRDALKNGEWLVGEWLFEPHGVKYRLGYEAMFMPYALFRGDRFSQSEEASYDELMDRVSTRFQMPHVIADDGETVKIEEVRRYVVRKNDEYSIDKPEGAVWRREGVKNGKPFITRAKWVRHDHVPGMYWESRQNDARNDN